MRIVIITILFLGIISACSRKPDYPKALSNAIQCIDTRPDSALYYLNLIPDSTLWTEPEETSMYHSLLTIKAHDKLYHRHTSDSLIKTIVRFYDQYGDMHKQMEAYYYLGSVYRDMNNAPRAVKTFQQMINLGKNTMEYALLGKAYGQISILLESQDVYEEAEKAGKKEFEYHFMNHDSARMGYALRNIGRTFQGQMLIDSSLYYYQQALEISPDTIKNDILEEMPYLYFEMNEILKAKKLILELFANQLCGANNWLLLGKIYKEEKQIEEAYQCFLQVLREGSVYQLRTSYKQLSEIEKLRGNYLSALEYTELYKSCQDSINKITKTETTAKIQALYNFQLYEEENLSLHKEVQYNRSWILSLSLVLILTLWFGSIYFNRIKLKKEKIIEQERKLRFLEEMRYLESLEFIEENKLKLADLEKDIAVAEKEKDIFKQRLIATQKELLEYSNRKVIYSQDERTLLETNLRDSDIYLHFHKVRENPTMKISEKDWGQLREAIDTTFHKFTDRLRMLCPKITTVELRICYLIKISIPVKDMAILMIKTSAAITNTRVRLYKKITGTEGKADKLDQFITDL